MSEKLFKTHCPIAGHGTHCCVSEEILQKQVERKSKLRRKKFKKDIQEELHLMGEDNNE